MKNSAIEFMELYDLIIYIPIDESIKLKDDNFRDVDPIYRKEMALIMDSLYIIPFDDPGFDKYGYKVAIISGSRKERVASFKEYIKALI